MYTTSAPSRRGSVGFLSCFNAVLGWMSAAVVIFVGLMPLTHGPAAGLAVLILSFLVGPVGAMAYVAQRWHHARRAPGRPFPHGQRIALTLVGLLALAVVCVCFAPSVC